MYKHFKLIVIFLVLGAVIAILALPIIYSNGLPFTIKETVTFHFAGDGRENGAHKIKLELHHTYSSGDWIWTGNVSYADQTFGLWPTSTESYAWGYGSFGFKSTQSNKIAEHLDFEMWKVANTIIFKLNVRQSEILPTGLYYGSLDQSLSQEQIEQSIPSKTK